MRKVKTRGGFPAKVTGRWSCMTDRLMENNEHSQAGVMQAEPEVDERLRPLLQKMLIPIHRARETPLQFEIDSGRIVEAALREFLVERPESERAQWQDWQPVRVSLDQFVLQALVDVEEPGAAEHPQASGVHQPAPGDASGDLAHALAVWLKRLFNVMRDVDQRAIEILALRLEGYGCRDIAGRQGTGMRLVRRIIHEMGTGWGGATQEG